MPLPKPYPPFPGVPPLAPGARELTLAEARQAIHGRQHNAVTYSTDTDAGILWYLERGYIFCCLSQDGELQFSLTKLGWDWAHQEHPELINNAKQ